jgi:lipid-binding SYLF domain-containing protein
MKRTKMAPQLALPCWAALATALAAGPCLAAPSEDQAEKKAAKAEAKREEIDAMAQEALDEVLTSSPRAKAMFEQAAGHAVFDNWHTSFAVAGGSGTGVAVRRDSGERTYMKMRTVGLKLGLGIQKCQVVFLFETAQRFERFVNDGWEAEAGAEAAVGGEGASLAADWRDGMATFRITEKGLMLSADLSGTKYDPAKKLN